MTTDWNKHRPPSLGEFELIAGEAYRRLPRSFRDMTEDVLIRVEDFPTDEVLELARYRVPFRPARALSGRRSYPPKRA